LSQIDCFWPAMVSVSLGGGIHVENVDESASQAESLGGKTVVPAMDVPGVGRMAFLEDPTGAKFAVFTPGEHSGAPQASQKEGTFGWSELATNDTNAAGKFYSKMFNWGTKVDEKMGYTEFQVGGRSIGGMLKLTPQHGDAPPNWLPYVQVGGCNATTRKVKELGGSVIVPPTNIPDVGNFSVFADPNGAVLAVIQLKT
jgi:predicted enzyme related to lactoylglutathione lyase